LPLAKREAVSLIDSLCGGNGQAKRRHWWPEKNRRRQDLAATKKFGAALMQGKHRGGNFRKFP